MELESVDPNDERTEEIGDLMNGKYRFVYLTKAQNRGKLNRWHIDEVMSLNAKIARLEVIKVHPHKMFECNSRGEAQAMME